MTLIRAKLHQLLQAFLASNHANRPLQQAGSTLHQDCLTFNSNRLVELYLIKLLTQSSSSLVGEAFSSKMEEELNLQVTPDHLRASIRQATNQS